MPDDQERKSGSIPKHEQSELEVRTEGDEDPGHDEIHAVLADPTMDMSETAEFFPEIRPQFLTIPFPLPLGRSGRYSYSRAFKLPHIPKPFPLPHPAPQPALSDGSEAVADEDVNAIALYFREEVQLDVDGRYPQMTISGTRSGMLTQVTHWIASVKKVASNKYEGPIWYKDGLTTAIPHMFVSAVTTGGVFSRQLEITFSGGGAIPFKRTYKFESGFHRRVEFEYDCVSDAVAVTQIQTHAHPNSPATLPNESLSIETVFRRSGFDVKMSGGNNVIPIAAAGVDALWTDQEMHDAMQLHWSRFANKPQWSMWVLFARMHQIGSSLGGIMFDDIGPNHRQGTAIFSHAFISNPPAGDPAPAAWVERMRFWTAVHEMGHAFNLAHSWQKALGTPWIPLANEPEARSFMNYPYYVIGKEPAFFADFAYRFSDSELQFMRHAPERFVQMGNEAWFSHHGFQEAASQSRSTFQLRLSTGSSDNRFAFLVPPVVELALVNDGSRPKVVSASRISERSSFLLIISAESRPARIWRPYLRHCGEPEERVLQPGQALYDSVMVGAGSNGWDMAEPGRYTVQAVLELDGEYVYSNQLELVVERPESREEERLAADLFTPQVGQVLSVNGSRSLDGVNAVLARAMEIEANPISQLAAVALATPLSYRFKVLESGKADPGTASLAEAAAVPTERVELYEADPQAAANLLDQAVSRGADRLVNAMGHIRFLRDAPLLTGTASGADEAAGRAAMSIDGTGAAAAVDAIPVSDQMSALLRSKAPGITE